MSESIWKKEITLRRTPSGEPADPELEQIKAVAAAAEPPAVELDAPAEKSVPFWRKEVTLRRAPKQPKPERQPTQKQPKAKQEKPPKQEEPPKQPRRTRERKAHAKRGSHVPKKLVGLKVGASQVAAAYVSNNGAAELVRAARAELEPGIIVGGELREPEKLTEALRDFFERNNLPRRNVRLGLANNRIGVRTFDVEGIDDPKQLDNAVRFRAQEALPIPIEDAVIDYQLLSESKGEDGTSVKRILLVVAYRELVDRYVQACRRAGVELVGVDLEAFALLRAMGAPREDGLPSEAALVVVSVGHERSTFAVSDGRVCEFTRVLEWGGSLLNVAIGRALGLAPSEAEPIKRALDLTVATPPDGLTGAQFDEAREGVRRQIQSFARELVSSLQFYQNQPESLGIGEIVLTGGTAHMPGLAEELQRLIGVTVRVGDPLLRVRVAKKAVAADEQIGSLAVAIGLGIDD